MLKMAHFLEKCHNAIKTRHLWRYWPKRNSCFQIRDKKGVSIITKLRVNFSDLWDHRFRHNFNCISADCPCGSDTESTTQFLLYCNRYHHQRSVLFQKLKGIIPDYDKFSENDLLNVLLYGYPHKHIDSAVIITNTIYFINSTKRFAKLEAF